MNEYESVFNPPNCALVVLERAAVLQAAEEECVWDGTACDPDALNHTKNLYRLTAASLDMLGVQSNPGTPTAHCLSSMCLPEQAWERVLQDSHDWGMEAECVVNPEDFYWRGSAARD